MIKGHYVLISWFVVLATLFAACTAPLAADADIGIERSDAPCFRVDHPGVRA
jgi:hypothetical protein